MSYETEMLEDEKRVQETFNVPGQHGDIFTDDDLIEWLKQKKEILKKMNDCKKMLEERMACGMEERAKIYILPDGLAFAFEKNRINLAVPGAVISISKDSILKIAEKYGGQY